MLHRYSRFVVACTILLILAGSFVTSTDSGLSVPDWPTTYGWNMFTFPLSNMVGGIFYEHGHRLIASAVGMLTIGLAVWLWMAEPRRWMRWLGLAALGAIVAQGVLGGLTVLFFLPPAVSTAHAGLAEIFFCMTVAIAVFTSPQWRDTVRPVDDGRLRAIATTTTAVIYTQILIGAVMRHTGAGLAIPDFPLMFGHVVPDHWSAKIAVHFAHRVGAALVALSVLLTASYVWRRHTDRVELANPALRLIILTVVQVTLGALTVLSRRQVWINSLHVVCGALVLTMSLVITLRAWQIRIASLKPSASRTRVGAELAPPVGDAPGARA
ncbi:MAG TPA: COX15/CtaA family protein [Vicinamibacterales bacterium]|nr:COX15/CtaA family protein [Vicinamibacterales bacterium]